MPAQLANTGKIAFVADVDFRYQVNHPLELSEVLAAHGADVSVIAPISADTAKFHSQRGFHIVPVRRAVRRVDFAWLIGEEILRLLRLSPGLVIGFNPGGYIPAYLATRLLPRARLIYWAMELSRLAEGVTGLATRFQARYAHQADMVWSTGVERARVMQDDWRLLELPYVLVNTLTVPRQDPSGSLRKRMRNCRPGDQVVVYATSLGKQTAVPQLLQSVQMWRSGVKLALVGFGLEEFLNDMQQQIRDLAIQDRVEYLGAFAKQELFNSFSDVNLGVVLRNHRHAPDLNTVYITPSKLLEYAAYGIPVLCSDNPSLRFVEREGWGLCVDPDDPVALAGAVNALTLNPTALKRMGELARKRFVEEYCMEVQGQRLIEALQTRNLLPRLDRET